MAKHQPAVQIEHAVLTPVRHPINAARLLYSAPAWVLSGPIYLITVITLSSLVYSFWAVKDELVVAPLVLERESNTIESTGPGMISRVRVKEGDFVQALLDTVVEVQKTMVTAQSEAESLQTKAQDIEDERASQLKEYQHKKDQLTLSLKQTRESLENLAKDQKLLGKQMDDGVRNVEYLEGKLEQARRELKEEEALFKSRDITKAERDRARSKVDDLEKSLADAKSGVAKTRVSLGALSETRIQNEIVQVENELAAHEERQRTREKRFAERLADLEEKLKQEETLVKGVRQEGETTRYSSQFSGIVTKIHVKPGHMVSVGAPLVTIIKDSAALEGRSLVQNKDIGRMKRGDKVQIKYFAYPYQEFGIPTGRISYIAKKPGDVEGQQSLYVVRVALDADTISKQGSNKEKVLEVGLEGTAEIKTGEKRLIELLFTPVSRFFTQEDE